MSSSNFCQREPAPIMEERTCDVHGAYQSRTLVQIELEGEPLRVWGPCPQCAEEAKQRDLARHERAKEHDRKSQIARAVRESNIPLRYADALLEDFRCDQAEQERVRSIARRFIDGFDPSRGTGLTLIGRCGAGKTLMGCGIVNELCQRGYSARYVRAIDFAREVRSSYAKRSEKTERDIFQAFSAADLVVLDECGVGVAEHDVQLLTDLIDARYGAKRATILVGNLTQDEIEAFLGERLADRLREVNVAIAFTWPSYRSRRRISSEKISP